MHPLPTLLPTPPSQLNSHLANPTVNNIFASAPKLA